MCPFRPAGRRIYSDACSRKRTHEAAIKAINSREVGEQYAKVNGVLMPSTPEEYAAYVAKEQAKWGKVIKAIGFTAE